MIDIIILILLLLGFLIGIKRGFFRQIMRFVGSVLSLIIAYLFTGPLSAVLPTFLPAPDLEGTPLLGAINNWGGMIDSLFYSVAAFFILFVVAKIVFMILASVLNLAAKIPVLKQMNALAGGVFGFMEAYIVIAILLLIVNFLPVGTIQEQLQSSILAELIVSSTLNMLAGLFQSFEI